MTMPYDAIYLAPHLDDAVLSCGGQIFDRVQAGQKILVLTIMAGEPAAGQMNDYIASLHSR
ncbi:MAG: PIG-L family deacetylase, partial [Anaerolineales bacterium]|nr:PIG-L family deacetylase [Anaerolineales bacterium]